MCYECGCNDPNYVKTAASITEDTIKKAAIANKMTLTDAKHKMLELLQKEVAKEGKKE